MIRSLLVLLILIATEINLHAQTQKGSFLLGGSDILNIKNFNSLAEYTSQNDLETKNTEVSISPIFGYFIIDNLSIGIIPRYSFQKDKNNSTDLSIRDISITAHTRYYLGKKKLKPFAHLGFGYINRHKQNDFDFDDNSPYIWNGNSMIYEAGIGLGYFITDHLSLDLFTLFSSSKTNMLSKVDPYFAPLMDHTLKSNNLAINLSLVFYLNDEKQ